MLSFVDLRYALRSLRRSPGFTIPAIAILALGMGAATAVFTVVHRVVLQPLPYPDAARLVRLWDRNESAGLSQFSVSPANYFSWREQSRSLEAIAALREDGLGVTVGDAVERLGAARVTASIFDVLGVQPVFGRGFLPDEDRPGAPAVTILSHAFAARIGSPAGLPGQSLIIDGRAHQVVGVLPEGFIFPIADDVLVLVPYALNGSAPEADAHYLRVVGRTTNATTVDSLRAEMATIAAGLEHSRPESNRGWAVRVDTLQDATVGGEDAERDLLLLFGAAGLLLVVTCFNVGGLWLARNASRQLEMTVRSALGAGRARLVRLLTAEALVIAGTGAILGLVVAWLFLDALLAVHPDALARREEIVIDGWVFAFACAISVVVALVPGVAPGTSRAGRLTLSAAFAGAGRVTGGNHLARRLLVGLEIAVAVTLVACAALLARNLIGLAGTDPGFNTDHTLTMALRPPAARYAEPEQRAQVFNEVLQALDRLPGVHAAAAAHRLPMFGNSSFPLIIAGRDTAGVQPPSVNYRSVAGPYFEAMGAPLLSGRDFTPEEMWTRGGAVIVNRALVDAYLSGADPLTTRLRDPRGGEFRVVGIVENMRENDLDAPADPALYFPYRALPSPGMTLVVRTEGDPVSLARALRHAIQSVDPGLALAQMQTMEEYLGEVTAEPRFQTLSLTAFAVIALVLAAIGVFTVVASTVAHRTREIGLRVALGATSWDIFGAIVKPGLWLAGAGTGAGLIGAVLLAWWFGGALFGVDARQPWLLAGVAVVLFVVAALATTLPARRAMRIDPARALRNG